MRGLLKDRGIKRVYILGAGFSAPLGLPLTRDLLKEIHQIASTKNWYNDKHHPYPEGQAEFLLEQLRYYFPLNRFSHKKIRDGMYPKNFDIEKFLSYALFSSVFGDNFSEQGDKFM